MNQRIKDRLNELQAEYQKGQERHAALEQELTNLKTSMLRISGAIQVLEELLVGQKENPSGVQTDHDEAMVKKV